MVRPFAVMAVAFSLATWSCVRPASTSLKAQATPPENKELPAAAPLSLTVERSESCTTPAVRKEFRSLSADEWQRFVAGVKRLMERPKAGTLTGPSVYDQLVKIQVDHYEVVQGYAVQLPFYRWLLKVFETELRKIDATLAIPYWDWVRDAKTPHQSPLLTAAYLGGNGVGEKHCVVDGAFANHTVYFPTQGCLERNFNRGASIAPFPDAKHMKKMFNESRSLDTFRQFISYVPAGSVQQGVGGHLNSPAMANDPIFWLHMAYVDKYWADWQAKSPKNARAVNGLLKNHQVANADTPIAPSPYKIGDVLAIKDLCYSYQSSSAKAAGSR